PASPAGPASPVGIPGPGDGPPAPRREAGIHLDSPDGGLREHGALAGTAQAWLADWLVAEYRAGGGDAVARLIADCAVEQPLHARLAVIYDLLYAKWADKDLELPRSPQ